ncbi:hypothetical protein VTL71DRAFT_13315 [Oculimacula yallundae]|uniref:Uncharacterized protein n=1 Tax=Oculimacula yallundae TaxID=86028 RepID=A0ABR4CKK2_9HELO
MSQPINLNNKTPNSPRILHDHGPSSSTAISTHPNPSTIHTPQQQNTTPTTLTNTVTTVYLRQIYLDLLPDPDSLLFLASSYFSDTLSKMARTVADEFGRGVGECVEEFRRFVALKAWLGDVRGDKVSGTVISPSLLDAMWLLAISNTQFHDILERELDMSLHRAVADVTPEEGLLKAAALRVMYRKFFHQDALTPQEPEAGNVKGSETSTLDGSLHNDNVAETPESEEDFITLNVLTAWSPAFPIRVNKYAGPEAVRTEIGKSRGWRYMRHRDVLLFEGEEMDLPMSFEEYGVGDGDNVYLKGEWEDWEVSGQRFQAQQDGLVEFLGEQSADEGGWRNSAG